MRGKERKEVIEKKEGERKGATERGRRGERKGERKEGRDIRGEGKAGREIKKKEIRYRGERMTKSGKRAKARM